MTSVQKAYLVTKYKENLIYFNKNKNKNWDEWLTFSTTFEKPGKQGLVGIMTSKEDENTKYVFKISQYLNYLVEHEHSVMKGLSDLALYCPHYCKSYGIINCDVDPTKRKAGNPFHIKKKNQVIQKKVLLMEYIEKSVKFCSYIRSQKLEEDILYSTIKQVLLATVLSQNKKNFAHYDLHSDNIMMKQCNKDLVFLYIIDEENQFLVPTLGHYPIIIDFGFSYVKDMDNDYMWPSMAHTDVGFMSDRFDWVADPKLFLISISHEMKVERNSKKSKKLRKIVKNMFYPLSVEWDCGWDNLNNESASNFIVELFEENNEDSHLFREYENYCVDIIQSLIILPLEPRKYDSLDQSFKAFIEEFIKIENQIGNNFYNLYILKGIIDSAREVRVDYFRGETRQDALKKFRLDTYEKIEQVAKFCKTKDIKFEKMLCSLLVLAKSMEGVYYEVIQSQMDKKEKEYKKLPLNSIEQMYGCIETNIPDNYIYNKDTIVFQLDSVNEKCTPFKLSSEEITNLNDMHHLTRGTYLHESRQS
jgi:hypothetical protein